LLEGWSSKYDWVERVAAWDRHLDGIARRAAEGAAEQWAERFARERESAIDARLDRGKAIIAKGERILGLGGQAPPGEPPDPVANTSDARVLAVAARLIRLGEDLVSAAVHEALAIEFQRSSLEQDGQDDPGEKEKAFEMALEELDRWKAKLYSMHVEYQRSGPPPRDPGPAVAG
jgi:hypothetical protein